MNFVSKKLDPLTWSEQMHVDHKQATQVKYMLCQANNRLLVWSLSPTFLSCDCSLQHKLCPPHHPSQFSTWFHQSCDQLHKALWSNRGLYLQIFQKKNSGTQYFIKNDWLEFQFSQIHVCLHKIWNSLRENWNPANFTTRVVMLRKTTTILSETIHLPPSDTRTVTTECNKNNMV